MTTTVLRRSLTTLVDKIRYGLVLAISDPLAGSRRTHHTSPRRGIGPRLRDLVGQRVPFPLDSENVRIAIGDVAGANQLLLARSQLSGDRLADISSTVARSHALQKLPSQIVRKGEG